MCLAQKALLLARTTPSLCPPDGTGTAPAESGARDALCAPSPVYSVALNPLLPTSEAQFPYL